MKINENLKATGKLKITKRDQDGNILSVHDYDNVVCTVAKTMIANNLTDASPDNVMRINYGALGSNTTAPTVADTQLGTETYRNLVASETNSANVAYITLFFSQTETTGTYKEAGLFCNATGTANSGILLSHVAIDETKTNVQTLTIDWTITIN